MEGKMNYLVVVDMQNDFISGTLGTEEAKHIVANVLRKIQSFDGIVVYTRDTHTKDYLKTREGKNLPILHCVKGSYGWELAPVIETLRKSDSFTFDKPSFGSMELGRFLEQENMKHPVQSVEFVGLCTDICVISNVMIAKASVPEAEIIVDSSCCAGATVKGHEVALEAMRNCQVTIR